MNEESSGTKKMFSLYQTLLDVLEKVVICGHLTKSYKNSTKNKYRCKS